MKKLFILSTAAFLIAGIANAQAPTALARNDIKTEKRNERKELRKLNGNTVSQNAKDQFAVDFGNTPGDKWERTANFDEVTFRKNGKEMTAYYDDESKLVGTTNTVTFNSIPLKAQNLIKKQYKGYRPGEVLFFDDNEANETDMLLYGLQFDDVDSYYVSLKKGSKTTVVQVSMDGGVSYFTQL